MSYRPVNLNVTQRRVRDLKVGDVLASGPAVVTISQVARSNTYLVVTTADGTRLPGDKLVWVKKGS